MMQINIFDSEARKTEAMSTQKMTPHVEYTN